MSVDFKTIVNGFKEQTAAFESETVAMSASMQGRTISKDSVEGSHGRIMEVFRKTMEEINRFKEQIHKGTTHSNQEQLIQIVQDTIALETRLEGALTRLNNHILTHYPEAGIDYGRSCINPIMLPVTQENDVPFQNMLKNFTGLREIRGDGNCFVASFAARFIESLMDQNTREHIIHSLYEDRVGIPEIKGEILGTLLCLQKSPQELERTLSNNQKILPFISYFRHLAADEMKRHSEQFETGFRSDLEDVYREDTHGRSFAALVDQYVIPMGIDFSQPMITALCQRMNFPVRIFDSRLGHPEGFNVLDGRAPRATFCRRGAHYFVLYTPRELAPPPRQATEITVTCELPFGHTLFIRGSGNGLNWNKGIPLCQISRETWTFNSTTSLRDIDFKFLIDDQIWENGPNRKGSSNPLENCQPLFTFSPDMETLPSQQTRITVRFQAKPGDKLFIRGTGPQINWAHGIELHHEGADLWTFETREAFSKIEYKILLNDIHWEQGNNHTAECGKKEEVSPRF